MGEARTNRDRARDRARARDRDRDRRQAAAACYVRSRTTRSPTLRPSTTSIGCHRDVPTSWLLAEVLREVGHKIDVVDLVKDGAPLGLDKNIGEVLQDGDMLLAQRPHPSVPFVPHHDGVSDDAPVNLGSEPEEEGGVRRYLRACERAASVLRLAGWLATSPRTALLCYGCISRPSYERAGEPLSRRLTHHPSDVAFRPASSTWC